MRKNNINNINFIFLFVLKNDFSFPYINILMPIFYKKKVQFNLDRNLEYSTYDKNEYDRTPIDHVLYRRAYNRISDEEFKSIFVILDLYKLYEMPVHKDSLKNNAYTIKSKMLNML